MFHPCVLLSDLAWCFLWVGFCLTLSVQVSSPFSIFSLFSVSCLYRALFSVPCIKKKNFFLILLYFVFASVFSFAYFSLSLIQKFSFSSMWSFLFSSFVFLLFFYLTFSLFYVRFSVSLSFILPFLVIVMFLLPLFVLFSFLIFFSHFPFC